MKEAIDHQTIDGEEKKARDYLHRHIIIISSLIRPHDTTTAMTETFCREAVMLRKMKWKAARMARWK